MTGPLATAPLGVRPDRRAVADWTLQRLHEMVLTGELQAGEVLKEIDLTHRLGVSRSPVRDALRELENAGLLDVDELNGRRTLRAFDVTDVAESYDLRIELESLSARYAARDVNKASLQELTNCFNAMNAAIHGPLDVWLPLDFAFHAQVAAITRARRVPQILSGVWAQHQALLRRLDRIGAYPSTEPLRREVIRDHKRILTSIGQQDPEAADAAVRHHLGRRRETILATLTNSGRESV